MSVEFKSIFIYFFPGIWALSKMVFIPTAFNRRMMRGKIRRWWLVYFRRDYVEKVLLPRRRSSCLRIGACCELGVGCPAFDKEHRLCTIHPHKPLVCQLFPITEEDLKDRDAVYPDKKCGFTFVKEKD